MNVALFVYIAYNQFVDFRKKEIVMGILYREVVEYRQKKLAKIMLGVIVFFIFLNGFLILSEISRKLSYFVYFIYLSGLVLLAVQYNLWKKCKRKFRYQIIDNELIIERFEGNRRKVELSLNVKYIVKIEKVKEKICDDIENKEYCCSLKNTNLYRVTYKIDDKMYSFCFEPSNNFINKINAIMNKRSLAS